MTVLLLGKCFGGMLQVLSRRFVIVFLKFDEAVPDYIGRDHVSGRFHVALPGKDEPTIHYSCELPIPPLILTFRQQTSQLAYAGTSARQTSSNLQQLRRRSPSIMWFVMVSQVFDERLLVAGRRDEQLVLPHT